jgi:sporulation protein YlmC with PRC-barrel domain
VVRLTDLLGCRVETSEGKRLGHVVDVRVARRSNSAKDRADQQWRITGLLIGHRGLLERLGTQRSERQKPTHEDDIIGWERIERIGDDGKIVVSQASG